MSGTSPLMRSSLSNMLSSGPTLVLKKSLTGVTTNEQLNQLLDDTTIKRGCCMRHHKGDRVIVKVKIPRPKEVVAEVPDSVEDRFNYIERTIEIPSEMCDQPEYSSFQPATKQCDDFMKAYCENLKYDLSQMTPFNSTDWNAYSPECACFGQKAEDLAPGVFAGFNIPPKCYMPGCGDPTSYLDRVSRDGACELTVCNALFSASDLTAG